MKNISGNVLKKRILLYTVLFMLTLAVFQYIFVSLPLFHDLIKSEHNNLVHTGETRAMVLSQWYEKIEEITNQVASRSMARKKLLEYLQGSISISEIQNISNNWFNDVIQYSDKVIGIKRTAADGNIVAECGMQIPEKNILFTSYSDARVNFSFPVKIGEDYLVITKVRITNISDETLGYDEVIFKLNDLLDIFNNLEGIGSKSSVILFYQKGDVLKFPFPLKPNMWNRELLRLVEYPDVRKKVMRSSCYVSDKVVITNSLFADKSWGIFIIQDKMERYSSVRQRVLFSFFVVLFLVLLMVIIMYKQLTPLTSSFLMLAEDLQDEVDKKLAELKKSEEELATLKGMIPICSSCKKIRDDKGFWSQVENYISDHSEAIFSHSLCPDCYQHEKNECQRKK